ncbi:LSU ribosomal protein L23P [Hydrogenispora ethanolica]|jgi:large subunit ribosomal protein L23|uniref:Large ribosomal subunit protein uL23 n=1 Tax=Hydrogenispora ethanolica TaxID=1082276 RepID=A0A4R1RL41_HYDET|nr:50S ribosomal protein L23 [Hydrogenispora ethanolica]TCL66462.1 LSU ribosomal protein L23P [Hydrogenispora ethanolica]
MDAHTLIKRPVITEKTTKLMEDNKYCFIVDPRANKTQIKQAIEEIFKVKVKAVNTFNSLGKVKRMGKYEGRRPSWKRAIVTLEGGSRIEFFEGV